METTPQPKVTHWKKLTNPNYIGSHDFQPGQELVVTIESVKNEMVKCFDGSKLKEEDCIIATLKGAKKPMILNKTNCKIITRLYDTPYIEDWIGKKIILYVAKVKAFGEVTDAIRIKHQKVS
jgi:hypothetical protein